MTVNKQVDKRLLTMICVSKIPIMRTTSSLKTRHALCIIDYCGSFGENALGNPRSENWRVNAMLQTVKCREGEEGSSKTTLALQARYLNGKVSAFETHDMCLYFQENVEHCVRSWRFVSLCVSASAPSDQGIGPRQQRSLKAQSN